MKQSGNQSDFPATETTRAAFVYVSIKCFYKLILLQLT